MKRLKYLLFLILLVPFTIYADSVEIIDMDYETSHNKSGILYSDGKLLISGKYYDKYDEISNNVYENVKKFNVFYYKGLRYLTNDNVLHAGENTYENVKDFLVLSNDSYLNDLFYIDNDGNLFGMCVEFGCTKSYPKTLLAANVKEAKLVGNYPPTVLYITNDKELYVLGRNYFGSKINDGNNLEEPTKILDNIIDFGPRHALDSEGNLYVFNSHNPRPTIYKTNIKKVIVDNLYSYKMVAIDNSNKSTFINVYDDNYDSNVETFDLDISVKKTNGSYLLSNDNKLYYYSNKKIFYIDDNVTDINFYANYDDSRELFMYLKSNNELYTLCEYYSDFMNYNDKYSVNELVQKLYHDQYATKPILYLKNVKSIKFAHKKYIVLTDNSVLRTGSGQNGVFFGSPTYDSQIPVKINDLINNDKEIKVNQIYLSTKGIYDYTVGDKFDIYATAIPFNAINKELSWSSSDTNIADVNSEGYVVTKGAGSVTITAKTTDGSVSESVTINVHPDVTGIEITNGSTATVERGKNILLTANIIPSDTIKKEMVWELLDNSDEYEIYLNNNYYDENGNNKTVEANQKVFRSYNGGSYRVKVSTVDKKYSAIITINVIEKVSYIKLNIPDENYDGYNAFIFLFEKNSFKATATAENETANNKNLIWSSSNPAIADVKQDGTITGYKAGRTIIKIESEDGGASRQFNVIVYDKNGNTEINPDAKITSAPVVSVQKYNDNQVKLSYAKVDNATGYEIYRSTNKTKNYKKLSTISSNVYIDTTISFGTTYYYKVIAYNASSKSSYSNVVSIKLTPNIVSNLEKDTVTSTSIKVSWDKENYSGYEVYVNGKKTTTISKNETISYNKTKLKANTTYKFKVRAYKKVGSKKIYGPFSSEVSIKTAPSTPSITVSNKDYKTLSVKMNSVKGATRYVLEKSLDKTNYTLVEELPSSGTLAVTDLEVGKTYYFRLKVCNSNNNCSSYSKAVSKKVVPATPTLSVSSPVTKTVLVKVTPQEGAVGYEIYRSTKKSSGYKMVATLTDEDEVLEYLDVTAKKKTYYYKVRTYVMSGEAKVYSSYSSVKKIKSK